MYRVFDEIKSEIASMEISADGRKILVSTIGTGIYLLSLDPAIRVIRHFEGHVQTRFLLRSAFGAGRDRFIITGSEGMPLPVDTMQWKADAQTRRFTCIRHRNHGRWRYYKDTMDL
jgi:hypothetical protein